MKLDYYNRYISLRRVWIMESYKDRWNGGGTVKEVESQPLGFVQWKRKTGWKSPYIYPGEGTGSWVSRN